MNLLDRSAPSRREALAVAALCLHLAVVTGAVSFGASRMAANYGRPDFPVSAGVDLQRDAWEAFASRSLPSPSASILVYTYSTRILVPGIARGIVAATGASWEWTLSGMRLLSIWLAYGVFYVYLRREFDRVWSLIGLLFMAATIPLIFNSPVEIPTDFPELIVFTLGMWCILSNRPALLLAVVVVGTLNRETACFLVMVHFFVAMSRDSAVRAVLTTTVGAAVWLAMVLGLHWWVGRFSSPLGSSLMHNVPGLLAFFENFNPFNNYLFYFYLLGVAWFIPYLGWAHLPLPYRKVLVAVPLMLAVYVFGGGFLNEPREIIVFYPIMIPPSLWVVRRLVEGTPCEPSLA
jgi:hypothetical protein